MAATVPSRISYSSRCCLPRFCISAMPLKVRRAECSDRTEILHGPCPFMGAEEVTEGQEDARRGGEGAGMIFTFWEILKLSWQRFKHNPNTPFTHSKIVTFRHNLIFYCLCKQGFVFTRAHLLVCLSVGCLVDWLAGLQQHYTTLHYHFTMKLGLRMGLSSEQTPLILSADMDKGTDPGFFSRFL